MIQSDLFYGYDLIGQFVPGFVDDSIGALADFVDALVALGLNAP